MFDHDLVLLEVLHGRQRSELKNETLIILVNELRLDDPILNLKVLDSVGDAFVEIFIYLVVMDVLAGLQRQIIVQNIQLNFFRELQAHHDACHHIQFFILSICCLRHITHNGRKFTNQNSNDERASQQDANRREDLDVVGWHQFIRDQSENRVVEKHIVNLEVSLRVDDSGIPINIFWRNPCVASFEANYAIPYTSNPMDHQNQDEQKLNQDYAELERFVRLHERHHSSKPH